MLSDLSAELALRQLPCGGWAGLASSSQPAIEPTCYSALALGSVPAGDIERAQDFLLHIQNPNGSWPVIPGDDQDGGWVTSLPLMALRDVALAIPARLHGFHWLLCGQGIVLALEMEFRTADRYVRFDPDKYGWPWFPDTVSWVVPTAFAILALNQVPCSCGGLEQVPSRVDRGIEMLMDRACPSGGWNAGNGVVYGTARAPHTDDTAIALLALRDQTKDPVVQNSVDYLEQVAPTLTAPWSLACAILALAAHGRPIASLSGSLANFPDLSRTEDTSTLAVVCLTLDQKRALEAFGGHAVSLTRRDLLIGSAALAAGTAVTTPFLLPKYHSDQRPKRSRVAILNVQQYTQQLDQILAAGLRLFTIDVRAKTVVLKPNLVDYIAGNAINTPSSVSSRRSRIVSPPIIGAKSVLIAEGPGHQRDTQMALSQSSYEQSLRDGKIRFVDLNRDQLIRTPRRAEYTGMQELWLPRTVLVADFLVSMPKIKTHHWSGVTLSMKNMFGVVPGARYGWPKNVLHWKGIQQSILDLCATVPIHFVIADGIVAMEGNGPINGVARLLGKIVLADDPVAADATCSRLMGVEPERITHICEGSKFPGNTSPTLIDQVGETVNAPATPFQLVPDFRNLKF